ncbi:MAG: AbrB/MazE/SpoVT family DNA-binding domain-containing protein [Candidatus Omnitrophica bacterium]|nr:AbrB/MazE/SpoVT family DNA-binding domain-containing protein [Candidatus Omnitrophota bacterium]MCA9443754.1 AbrB/MazE/SpoVT family DNA-binding domain-containing protein [Candidatus Omnitrophota bacterium]
MEVVKLTGAGHLAIPKSLRTKHNWKPGSRFSLEDTEQGLIVRPLTPYPGTQVDDLIGCVGYRGPEKSLSDMEKGIRKGAKEFE